MEANGERLDIEPTSTSTIEGGSATTSEDLPREPPPDFRDDPATTHDDAAGSLDSSVETIYAEPDATLDMPAGTVPDEGITVFWDPQQTHPQGDDRPAALARLATMSSKGAGIAGVPGFEIISELGRGGMGVIHKARQIGLNRLVALKMIRDDRLGNPETLARFMIEAEALGRLNHPHIVRIYQIGAAFGAPYVALELLEGGTLSRRLSSTPQPVRDSATLLATLARAMHAAHLAGIVHRDLKPSNVLFNGEGTPKIADFGLAKRLEVEDGETRFGQVMGTLGYIPPEQADGGGRKIGPQADIYSLGAILYEMLTGRPPIKGANTAETLMMVLNEDPVPPSRLRPRLPFDLETICLKCIEREPRKRYADALSMADDLDRYLAGQSIRARRTPVWERGLKLARRRPVTTVMMAVGLVAIGIYGFMVKRENERLSVLRMETDRSLFEGQGAVVGKRWDDALELVAPQLSLIEREPGLADMRSRATRLVDQVKRGLAEEKAGEETREKLVRFDEARDGALFLDTTFNGFEATHQPEAAGRAARNALEVFGRSDGGDQWILADLPRTLTPRETNDVKEGFYQLLLILADAVAQLGGANPEARAEQALAVLDQAAKLRWPATKAYHLRKAAYLTMKGDSDGAEREQAEADKHAPADAFDSFLTGRELSKRSEWPAAIPHFEAVLQHQPDHFWAQCLLGICRLQTHEPSKAKPSLNACLQRKPNTNWLYLLRGIASAGSGEVARSMAKRYPDQAKALLAEASAQFDAAEDDYRKALELVDKSPENADLQYILRVNRGLIRLDRLDLKSAEADLLEAITINDRRFDAFSGLGQVYQRMGKTEKALEQFTKAIDLRPDWAPLYRGRAVVLRSLKNLSTDQRESALRDLDEAIRRWPAGRPEIADDLAAKAALLQEAKRTKEALAACDAALKVVPGHAAAHHLRIYLLLELKRYDELIQSIDVALAVKPTADLYELYGMALEALHDYHDAIKYYHLSQSLRPEKASVSARLGWAFLASGAEGPAVLDFNTAIRLDPSNPDPYVGRGLARVQLGQHREAVNDAEEALRRGKESWRIAYNAARIYSQAGSAVSAESMRKGQVPFYLIPRYQDRAAELVREALKRSPAEERNSLLRDTILPDPVFKPIQRRLRLL